MYQHRHKKKYKILLFIFHKNLMKRKHENPIGQIKATIDHPIKDDINTKTDQKIQSNFILSTKNHTP
jgi:uncharacterized membrane protein